MKKIRRSSKKALYILLAVQAILAFVLGVFGNKVAELINISPRFILVSTISLMVLSLAATIVISRYENRIETLNQLPLFPAPSLSERLSRLLLNRIATIFPLGIVAGALIGFMFALLIPMLGFKSGIGITDFIFINSYEIVSFIIALLTIFIISRRRRDISLILSYSFGFAISISGVIIMLHPEDNYFYYTLLGWSIELAFASFVMRSRTVDALYNDITDILQNLLRDRTSKG
jgi:hypothetical protein